MCLRIQFLQLQRLRGMCTSLGEMRHDPTLRLNKNDSKVNFSQSSPHCAIETFLKRDLDFTLSILLSQSWLAVEDLN